MASRAVVGAARTRQVSPDLPAPPHPSLAPLVCACSQCEVVLEGEGPWALPDGGGDVQLVFTPGHTAGCVSLLYRPDKALLTGDHLAWSHRMQRLTIFRAYNWHSVELQLASVAALRRLDFLHVLPGHGRRARFADAADRERQLEALLAAEGYAASPAAS